MGDNNKHWYLAEVKPGQELKLSEDIRKFGGKAYIPLRRSVKIVGDITKVNNIIMNKGRLYINCTEDERQLILRSFPYIYRFQSNGKGGAAIISDFEMQEFIRSIDSGNEI